MTDAPRVDRFLEPVYLNESMALNCAAYLFKGVSLESTDTTTREQRKEAAIKAGLPFLADFIGLTASTGNTTTEEQRSARKFTVGGLHMNVLDALAERNMVTKVTQATDDHLDRAEVLDKYVHLHVILRPSDYYALLELLRALGPLLVQLAHDFGESIALRNGMTAEAWQSILIEVDKYSSSLQDTVAKLVDDYMTSGQLEMVMWLTPDCPIGVVDLDMTEHDPRALKARLTGGRYHVFGKVIARARKGQRFSLLQRTMLFEMADLFRRLQSFTDQAADPSTEQPPSSIGDADRTLREVIKKLDSLIRLEIKGPAIRVAAMSVCL